MASRRLPEDQLRLFTAADAPSNAVTPAEVDAGITTLAAALPRSLRFGTSSWSFPGWAGIVYGTGYSKAKLASHGLEAYAKHPLLRTVGVDRTYYGAVAAETLASYAAVVPEDFRFLVKAHELCTIHRYPMHDRYGGQRGKINKLFLEPSYASDYVVAPFVEGLGVKGGPLLFQFSPLDVAGLGGPDLFVNALYRFLSKLPKGPLYAVELRNAELFTARYREALKHGGAVHCLNAHPSMPGVLEQASHLSAFADKPRVIRWLLKDGYTYENARDAFTPFTALVDPDPPVRRAIAELCKDVTAPAYVIVNNKAEGSAPLSVSALARAIAVP